MYLYLYDSFLNAKRFSSQVARIETRITDLGIGGKIFRMSPLRNISEVLADEILSGITTVVAVGDDKTLSQIINLIAPHSNSVVVGFIPVGPDATIHELLGIPNGEKACDVLAARIVEKVDLGKVNDHYFLTSLEIREGHVSIECQKKYVLTADPKRNKIALYNLQPQLNAVENKLRFGNPKDGKVEVVIDPMVSGWFKKRFSRPTIIPCDHVVLRSRETASVVTEGQKVLRPPLTVTVAEKQLNLVVGRNRRFN